MTTHKTESRNLLHPAFVGAGATLLIAAFATDSMYARTLLFQWNNLSIWLLTSGLIIAAIAALALLFDIARQHLGALAWPRFAGFAVAILLSILNAFVHSRDAYTAVMPQGIALSAVVAAILLILGSRGWSLRPAQKPILSTEISR